MRETGGPGGHFLSLCYGASDACKRVDPNKCVQAVKIAYAFGISASAAGTSERHLRMSRDQPNDELVVHPGFATVNVDDELWYSPSRIGAQENRARY